MNPAPTREDAHLILRLYELRREQKMREARAWFVQNYYAETLEESLKLCPPGSEENAYVRMVTSYWDMAASFLTSGILNEELFFQSAQELLLTWIRIQEIVPATREFLGNPNYLKNLEVAAERYVGYWARTVPGAYESFRSRMGARPQE